MSKFLNVVASIMVIIFFGFLLAILAGAMASVSPKMAGTPKNSVLLLDLEGVIMDGRKFLEQLRRYREDDHIKAIVIQVNSPGGVVGPSQEIYSEIVRTREEFKKPVVFSCLGLAASGAYYAAAAADKFIVNPGCLVGSIGVIMQFANLEKLLDWAKIERYAIKTGAFKDTGAEYRAMGNEEREMLQKMLLSVLEQFKTAIKEGRKVKPEVVEQNADGRIFTGEDAVRLGFADEVGALDDAIKVAAKLGGLGDKPEVFKPRANRADRFFEMLGEDSESRGALKWLEGHLSLKMSGQPMFIWPGALSL